MIYTLPFIAALIGWFTNYLAVKMLFHPREKRKFLFIEIQGIFPKRQAQLAEKIGKLVAKELVSFDDLKDRFKQPQHMESMKVLIEHKIDEFLTFKFPEYYPLLSRFVGTKTKSEFKGHALKEIDEAIPEVVDKYIQKTEDNIDIEEIVRQKVVEFSTDKLEEILHSILQKEFRFIELVGAVLGFLIGTIQVAIVLLGM